MRWRLPLPGLAWLIGRRAAPKGNGQPAPVRLLQADELVRPAGVLLALVLLVVASAIAVIYSGFQYRELFNRHQNLVSQGDELQVEWGQLVLEESAWAANNRVEQVAGKRLDMQVPEPGMIEIVRHER